MGRGGLWDWARGVADRHRTPRQDAGSAELYQTSTMSALLAGVYDGDVTVGELLRHGDFGLGTFDHLDGEMIVLDGVCHHLRADGSAVRAAPTERTPFAAVTRFTPEGTFTVAEPTDWTGVTQRIDDLVGSANLMCAIKVRGRFTTVDTRTVREQQRPYPPLVQATAGQAHTTFTDTDGTLAGFRMPAYDQGISVSGYHLHLLTADHARGGHCLDFTLARGTVEYFALSELHLSAPDTDAFRQARLDGPANAEQIRQTEGGH